MCLITVVVEAKGWRVVLVAGEDGLIGCSVEAYSIGLSTEEGAAHVSAYKNCIRACREVMRISFPREFYGKTHVLRIKQLKGFWHVCLCAG
jgi:high-affinity nickel permease